MWFLSQLFFSWLVLGKPLRFGATGFALLKFNGIGPQNLPYLVEIMAYLEGLCVWIANQ